MTTTRQVYGLFRDNCWLVVTRLAYAKAIQAGRIEADPRLRGCSIRRMGAVVYREGCWDAPTFIACSDPIE